MKSAERIKIFGESAAEVQEIIKSMEERGITLKVIGYQAAQTPSRPMRFIDKLIKFFVYGALVAVMVSIVIFFVMFLNEPQNADALTNDYVYVIPVLGLLAGALVAALSGRMFAQVWAQERKIAKGDAQRPRYLAQIEFERHERQRVFSILDARKNRKKNHDPTDSKIAG